MKQAITLIVLLFVLFLTACEGSDVYQGEWMAVDGEGGKAQISFTPNSMTITGESGESGEWEYTQNSVAIENGMRTYGINLDNGLSYSIVFPVKGNTQKGAIADQNGQIIYIIGRNDYLSYDDVYGLSTP
ncbi:hypothetical protein AB9P05_21810 [Roseivirga sp. BDSF3-8]|uniref:hypothetical protein n=1 Tax=Roseivirga sp. BDSF3-8 TaxID=3241598 RepID=UPI003531E9E6